MQAASVLTNSVMGFHSFYKIAAGDQLMYSIRHDTEVPLLAGLCFVYQKKG